MNLRLVDGAILAGLLMMLTYAALSTRRYSRSVAGFLAAERCGGRYLISVASTSASLGVITLVGLFEQTYDVGFTSQWWPMMEGPAWIVMGLSGWVVYRYRQTRAMTLAQFFEMRYSRRFRVFAGVVGYVSGIINFGIFPAISARFFMVLAGVPDTIALAGRAIPTFPLMLALLIGIALFFTFVGGQISVMVTDFLQGAFANIAFAILMVFMLTTFKWSQISDVLLAQPAGKSLVHPFQLEGESQFNVYYYMIGVFIMFYTWMAWQGGQGFNAAARSPHEMKMANILTAWRWRVLVLIVVVAPICARTLMEHPDYAGQAAVVRDRMAALSGRTAQETATLRNQLRTPLALSVMLPGGMLGLAIAAGLAAHIGTHGAYLHTWGSIFVQDVLLPFRKIPLGPEQHVRWLKGSICGVALFIFLFSLYFPLGQYVLMFLPLTGAVFVGGAGSVIIGGLYWKRGTTAAAWAAMITGMVAAGLGIVISQTDAATLLGLQTTAGLRPFASAALYIKSHFSGIVISFFAMALAIVVYVVTSLLSGGRGFDMDRLLHRGAYAVAGDETAAEAGSRGWMERLGFDRAFSRGDRWVAYVTLGWQLFWTVVFVIVTAYNLAVDVPGTSWLVFWRVWTWFILAGAIVITLWFAIGGVRDLRTMYRLLATRRRDEHDDGRVEYGHGK